MLIIIAVTLLATIAVSVMIASQRRESDVYIEVALWPDGWYGHERSVYHFIIKNDGTFISYSGISRAHGDLTRRNFMRTIQKREEVALDERDFHYISELVNTVVAIENDDSLRDIIVFRRATVTLLYDKNVYKNLHTEEANDLVAKLIQLSPLSIRW